MIITIVGNDQSLFQLVYVLFIALMTIILLESKTSLTVLDCVAVVFVISFLFVELAQVNIINISRTMLTQFCTKTK